MMCGAHLYMVSAGERCDGRALARIIAEKHVDVIQATPFIFGTLAGAGWAGSKRLAIFCGGEAMPTGLANVFKGCKAVINRDVHSARIATAASAQCPLTLCHRVHAR